MHSKPLAKNVSVPLNDSRPIKKKKKKKLDPEDYEITHIIGKGATAIVKLATHKEKKTNVVFKIYEKANITPTHMKALRAEIRIMKKLDHPHIIKLYDVVESESQIMLCLEYLPGGSFKDYLRKKPNKKVTEREARIYFGQIIDAVRYMHTNCVFHRDLKLENILLDYKKDIKIIDFGFSVECEPEDQLSMF